MTAKNGPTALILVIDAVGVTTLEYLIGKGGRRVSLPNLAALGLGNLLDKRFHARVPPAPGAQFARAVTQASAYPDSTIGHREMVGVIDRRTYRLFPDGFPAEYVAALEREIGRKTFFNRMAGGMEAILENREEHERTGFPILYASMCDPVLQLGMNEAVIPVPEQHRIVDAAFALAQRMGVRITRVIGRSYLMKEGAVFRTPNRHDCTLPLTQATLVEIAARHGVRTVSVGKTAELVGARFDDKVKLTDPQALDPACGYRFVDAKRRDTNPFSIQGTLDALAAARTVPRPKGSFIFANFVDADSLFGHTRDVEGSLAAVEEFDRQLPRMRALLGPGDLVVVTADHGMEHRADYGYHSLEPMPMLAERVGTPFGLAAFSRDTLALAGFLVAQLFGCADEYVRTCGLEPYV